MRHERWYDASRKRFEYAVGELGGFQEGVAMQMLDVARGAELMGDMIRASDYAATARHIASTRHETALQQRADTILVRLGVWCRSS